jgi:hypothetical protein
VGAAITLRVTVNAVDPDTLPTVALIDVDPALIVVARPVEPLALLIEATLDADVFQRAVVVRFRLLLSLYVPVAVNCSVTPVASVGFTGLTVIDTSTGSESEGDEPEPAPPQPPSANSRAQTIANAGADIVIAPPVQWTVYTFDGKRSNSLSVDQVLVSLKRQLDPGLVG